MTMTALLSVSSQRNGRSRSLGNRPAMTFGMVSPTIMQNAIIPPKALCICELFLQNRASDDRDLQRPLSDGDCNEARFAKATLHCRLE